MTKHNTSKLTKNLVSEPALAPEVLACLFEYTPNLTSLDPDSEFYEVCMLSHFARRYFHANQFEGIEYDLPHDLQAYEVLLKKETQTCENEVSFMQAIRHFRHRMMILIARHQIFPAKAAGQYDPKKGVYEINTEQVLLQLSQLADALILHVSQWAYRIVATEFGTPINSSGIPQPFIVLAMGKLGGRELNFSSDIDLIFTYPESGETAHLNQEGESGRRKTKDNSQFFQRVAQKVIKLLDTVTEDGFVYRVDMRLRPLGDSGPLVISFSALEDYYQEQGRDWERYAMVKARVIGPLLPIYQKKLEAVLRPFTYRRYIDFSVIDALRQMKALIDREVRRREGFFDIKLSAGGIREIEFIVQVLQLIHGGRYPDLRTVSILSAFSTIEVLELLPYETLYAIKGHYLYFRRVENIIQSLNDEQTQQLPSAPEDKYRLMWLMGEKDWSQFIDNLQGRMQYVRSVFDTLIGQTKSDINKIPKLDVNSHSMSSVNSVMPLEHGDTVFSFDNCSDFWSYILQGDPIDVIKQKVASFQLPQLSESYQIELIDGLHAFYHEISNRTIGIKGREVLNQLVPVLLYHILQQRKASEVLRRLLHVLKQIVTRTTYLQLLLENHDALNNLIQLCQSSTLITKRLARYPHLLGELLDAKTLYHPLELDCYGSELRQYLLRITMEDEEERLNALCQFKQIQQLRIAAADIAMALPTMKVSDHLTQLAEVILSAVVEQAWGTMIKKHGLPSYLSDASVSGFYVVAYGKMAGWELGYRSDLDLVFLTDSIEPGQTQGPRKIDNQLFYQRLGQRVLHLLSARTNIGLLYEVDTRLRPQGESGLLVNDFAGFKRYLEEDAWTYELQALVRSRVVYTPTEDNDLFTPIRHAALSKKRNLAGLKAEISEMREKMRLNFQPELLHSDQFDIKYDRGGITDIEFIAQFWILCHAAAYPSLTIWPDNIRIFESLASVNLITSAEENQLCQIYVEMRNQIHHLSLQDKPGVVDMQKFEAQRQAVLQFWHRWIQPNYA